MHQARRLEAGSCRCQLQHHVQHNRTVLVRSYAAFHSQEQPQMAAILLLLQLHGSGFA
jgi:hypothetical protein